VDREIFIHTKSFHTRSKIINYSVCNIKSSLLQEDCVFRHISHKTFSRLGNSFNENLPILVKKLTQ
jgi:hypothetical protein